MTQNQELGELDRNLLLALLRLHPDGYGLRAQELIAERTGREYSLGAIYAGLARLEERGFLRSRKGEATAVRGGKAKLYFQLTAVGRRTLDSSLRAINSMADGLPVAQGFSA